tara:strand:+ start:900 stop:1043 length:144 start_codon:yes stop_codon:yes gene_type:complete
LFSRLYELDLSLMPGKRSPSMFRPRLPHQFPMGSKRVNVIAATFLGH